MSKLPLQYTGEISTIEASPEWKQRTIDTLTAEIVRMDTETLPVPAGAPVSAGLSSPGKKSTRFFTPKRILAAACALVVLSGAFALIFTLVTSSGMQTAADAAPAALPLPLPMGVFDDDGLQGVLYYTSDEEISAGWLCAPAFNNIPETLPVYWDTCYRAQNGAVIGGFSEPAMKEQMQTVATALSITLSVYTFDARELVPQLVGTTNEEDVTITMTALGFMRVEYKAALSPSAGSPPRTSEEAAEHTAYAADLLKEFTPLFAAMQQPAPHVSLRFDEDGNAAWRYTVYDSGGALGEQLRSLAFSAVDILLTDNGRVGGFALRFTDFTSPITEYPLLTYEDAASLLAEGQGVSLSGYEYPGADYLAGGHIAYFSTLEGTLLMPYYEFYCRLPDADGDDAYGVWRLPAVQPSLLQSPA